MPAGAPEDLSMSELQVMPGTRHEDVGAPHGLLSAFDFPVVSNIPLSSGELTWKHKMLVRPFSMMSCINAIH